MCRFYKDRYNTCKVMYIEVDLSLYMCLVSVIPEYSQNYVD